MNKNFFSFLFLIVLLAFGAGLCIGVFLGKSKLQKIEKVPLKEASQRVVDYTNKYLLPKNLKATLVEQSFDQETSLYKIKLKVGKEEFEVYTTLDGKYLFPQRIDITLSPQEKILSQIPKKENSEALLFVMSFCPFGNQAEKVIYPVVKLLGEKAKIEPHYVIYQNYLGGDPNYCLENGKYCSMHGLEELKEDLRELCIFKYQKEKFWDYLMEVNEKCSLENIQTCWEKIAQSHQIDIEKIKKCEKEEALSLLEKEVALNEKYQVTASPTLIVNGFEYQGERSPQAYKEAICAGFLNPPKECQEKLSTSTDFSGSCQ